MYCGEVNVKEFTTTTTDFAIPMRYILKNQEAKQSPAGSSNSELILFKQGEGRLYYRLAINFAPSSNAIPPLNCGFAVSRSYFLLHPSSVKEEISKNRDDYLQVKKGSLVLVRIKIHTEFTRYNVAVVDYLPAGFEIENPVLKTSGSSQESGQESEQKSEQQKSVWFNHVSLI